ncbi:phosphomannomutase/phosphoglucomutase [Candidatus Zixiibacteriota bacterium]
MTDKTQVFTDGIVPSSADFFDKPLIKSTGFREYDVRWRLTETDTLELNYTGLTVLGQAFGTWLFEHLDGFEKDPQVVVGHDFRSYSQNVKNAFALGLMATGAQVVDAGLLLSPTLYFAQHHLGIPAGAMITASHNENGWTGVKLSHGLSKTFEPAQVKQFRAIVEGGEFREGDGRYQTVRNIREKYIEDLVGGVRIKRPLKVVINTGNGTSGLITPEAFRQAGFEVVEVHTEMDWNFPHYNPNPEHIKFLKSIGRAVREAGADLGVGVDGDGDRLGIVDDRGQEVFSDKVGLLLARHLIPQVMESGGEPKFVIDVKSTYLFEKMVKPLGAEIIWEKTGHSYIKAAVRNNSATAGFERSGHMFFSKPWGRGYDDATLAGLIFAGMLSEQNKPLSEILAELPRSYQSPNMQPHADDTVKYDVVAKLQNQYEKEFESGGQLVGTTIDRLITINGIRVQFTDDSWFLVRASSNTPTLVVLGESFSSRKRLYDMMGEVFTRLKNFPEVGEFDQEMPAYKGED